MVKKANPKFCATQTLKLANFGICMQLLVIFCYITWTNLKNSIIEK